MKWQDLLRPNEQDELRRAEAARDAAREVYNATVRKLKSRCEARMGRLNDNLGPRSKPIDRRKPIDDVEID